MNPPSSSHASKKLLPTLGELLFELEILTKMRGLSKPQEDAAVAFDNVNITPL
jgi:hypothetical protein